MVLDKSHLTSRIREEALRLGFFKVGIAPAGPLPEATRFEEWLRAGMHGEMAYIEGQSEKRKDPGRVLEDARSIIVLAMNYHRDISPSADALKGKISCYAWGDDYHLLMKGRLQQVERFIRSEEPGVRAIHYVDTGPVMEKVWGARTSLGWMGKHTNLITQERGSWFFIGVILLNLELPYDSPVDDHCGICTRCIEICPTKAIIAPYVVDARLCISYLTIELRGSIPRALRPLIGNRIFGCDDCQEVCPWNRFAVNTPEKDFQPRDENLVPELSQLVQLTAEDFNARFHRSPVRRAKRDGFVRNAAIALGNSHRPEAVPALAYAMKDSSALVRAHAAWALGEVGTRASRRLLESAAETEADPDVREEIKLALRQIKSGGIAP